MNRHCAAGWKTRPTSVLWRACRDPERWCIYEREESCDETKNKAKESSPPLFFFCIWDGSIQDLTFRVLRISSVCKTDVGEEFKKKKMSYHVCVWDRSKASNVDIGLDLSYSVWKISSN